VHRQGMNDLSNEAADGLTRRQTVCGREGGVQGCSGALDEGRCGRRLNDDHLPAPCGYVRGRGRHTLSQVKCRIGVHYMNIVPVLLLSG